MKKVNAGILAAVCLAVVSSVALAQTSASQTTLVTVENYNRAQTDVNFARSWPAVEWIIVGLAAGQEPAVRSYLIDGAAGDVQEVALEVV